MKLATLFGLAVFMVMPFGCGSFHDGASTEEPVSVDASELGEVPCRSTAECPAATYCTTEDGVCNRPPGCKPGDICPAVCYGTCKLRVASPELCGGNVCPKGTFCCNASCGTCAPHGGACTQQICGPVD